MLKLVRSNCKIILISSRCARLTENNLHGSFSTLFYEVPEPRRSSHSIEVFPGITMGRNRKNRNKNKENQNQQSPQQSSEPSKSKADSPVVNEEPEQQGLLSSILSTAKSTATQFMSSVVSGSSKPEEEPKIETKSVINQGEEKVPENDMGKRNHEEVEEKNDVEEQSAKSPEEKRQKHEIDLEGVDEEVKDVMMKMKEMSHKQKKKFKANLRKENEDLYDRYIKANSGRPDGEESPEKSMKTEEKNSEPSENSKCAPNKSPVKLNRNTPLLETKDDDNEAAAKEVLDTPVNWEDETWDQDESQTVEEVRNTEVEQYEKELKGAGELPKDHKKIAFGFQKAAKTTDWDGNEGWTEANQKKKEKKDDKPVKQEKKDERHGKQEGQGGAREKEGSPSKKNKKRNRNKDKQDPTTYPLGHAKYVAPAEHKPRQHSPGGSGTRNRSSSASRQKAWEPQVRRRANGSIILQEMYGDLFSAPDYCSLVHCVSADFHMGKGIAVQFKKRFGGVGDLLSFGAHAGGLAFLKRQERFIYYLVTKEQFHKKPSMQTLESSLKQMRYHCIQNHVQYVAMPCIGCGLDKLDWYNVRELLVNMFRDTQVEITVYWVE